MAPSDAYDELLGNSETAPQPEGDAYDQFFSSISPESQLPAIQAESAAARAQVADLSAPFDAGTSIAGDNMVGRGLGNVFNAGRELYRNPPSLRDTAAFGTRAVGAIGGGIAAGAVTENPLAIPLGMTGGEELANQLNQLVGLEDDRPIAQDALNFAGRGALNYALPGAGSVWRIPAARKAAASEAAKEGLTLAGRLGYGKSAVPGEVLDASSINATTPIVDRSGLFQAASTTVDPATGKFVQGMAPGGGPQTLFQMSSGLPDAKEAVGGLIRSSGEAIHQLAQNAGRPISIAFEELPIDQIQARAAQLRGLPDFQGVATEIDNFISTYRNQFDLTKTAGRGASPGGGVPNGISLPQAQQMIQNINLLERQAGTFDASTAASVFRGNISTPQQAELLAGQLGEFRRMLTEVVNSKAQTALQTLPRDEATKGFATDQLSYLNGLYGSLSTLQPAIQRAVGQSGAALVDPAKTSLNQAIGGNSVVGMAKSVGKAALGPFARSPEQQMLERNAQILSQIQQDMVLRSKPLIPRATNQITANSESARVVGFILRNFNLLDASAEDFNLPPEVVFASRPPSVQDEMVKQAAQLAPNLFDPAPEGYQSVFNGEFTDPFEKDMHLRKLVKSGASASDRMRVVEKGEYVPYRNMPNYQPQRQTPANLQSFGNMLDIPMEMGADGAYSQGGDAERSMDAFLNGTSQIDVTNSGL